MKVGAAFGGGLLAPPCGEDFRKQIAERGGVITAAP